METNRLRVDKERRLPMLGQGYAIGSIVTAIAIFAWMKLEKLQKECSDD